METNYKLLNEQLKNIIDGVEDNISNLSNASALLFEELEDVNWAGFYLVKNNDLYLGPFQGRIACTKIPYGKGVCGTALMNKQTLIVKNVHEFPGHIACDSRSNSEIVTPIFKDGKIIAVLDLDSASLNRFDENDKEGLEIFSKIIGDNYLWKLPILQEDAFGV